MLFKPQEFKNFPAEEKIIGINENVSANLVRNLMNIENAENLDTIEKYNAFQNELQKKISETFDNIGLGNSLSLILKEHKNDELLDLVAEISKMIYQYSHLAKRKHGSHETQFLEYVNTGEYGLNCEMSSALLKEGLERSGIKNTHIIKSFNHYMVAIIDSEDLLIIDTYKYKDGLDPTIARYSNYKDNIFSPNSINKGIEPEGIFLEIDHKAHTLSPKNHKSKAMYMYPSNIKYDLLQTLKSFRRLKNNKSILENRENNILSRFTHFIDSFDFDALKSKLKLFDPNDYLTNKNI